MAESHCSPWQLPVPREAVADSAGASYWSVYDCRWVGVGPAIPEELAELLAPPIVVGAAPVGALWSAVPVQAARRVDIG